MTEEQKEAQKGPKIPFLKGKSKEKDDADPITKDQGYPGGFDIPSLKERRYLWTSRIFASISIASIICNITMASAINTMMPLKEIRPYLVPLYTEGGVVTTIEPLKDTVDGYDLLVVNLVKHYVQMRHTVLRSNTEMERRWVGDGSYLQLTTGQEEYNRFLNNVSPVFDKIREEGRTFEISKIHQVSTLVESRLYQVEFTLRERDRANKEIGSKRYVSTLEIDFQEKMVPLEYAEVNPTGFTVLSYTTAEKTQ